VALGQKAFHSHIGGTRSNSSTQANTKASVHLQAELTRLIKASLFGLVSMDGTEGLKACVST